MRQALTPAARAAESGEAPVRAPSSSWTAWWWAKGETSRSRRATRTNLALYDTVNVAARHLRNYRLDGCVALVVTVEPQLPCVGAMIHARIATVVYGTPEATRRRARLGDCGARHTPGLNHRLAVVGGVLADECRALMQTFFRDRRG